MLAAFAAVSLAPHSAAAGSWGESWGQLLWGATAVPALGSWGVLALGLLLGAAAALVPSRSGRRRALFGVNRLMRGDAEGDGMSEVPSRCSTCCAGGCYTALGTTSCATGYAPVYTGRAGGIEAYTGPSLTGRTLCVDDSAAVQFTYVGGYQTRIMRYREAAGGAANGMDVISNACAVCCRE